VVCDSTSVQTTALRSRVDLLAAISRARVRGGAERRAPPADRSAIRPTRIQVKSRAAAAERVAGVAECFFVEFGLGANDGEVGRSGRTNDHVAAAAPAALDGISYGVMPNTRSERSGV